MKDVLYHDALRNSHMELCRHIKDSMFLIDFMSDQGLLSSWTMDYLLKDGATPYEKNSNLLRWLEKQPYKTYMYFKEALKMTRQFGCLQTLEDSEQSVYMEKELTLYKDIKPTDNKLQDLKLDHKKLIMSHEHQTVYRCNPEGEKKGLALIINNVNFWQFMKRIGSNIDRDNMKNLLELLGYSVCVHNDLTKNEMMKEIHLFANDTKHRDADSTVVVILSHGEQAGIYGTDEKLMFLAELKECFNNFHEGKPKLFIIQGDRTGPTRRDITNQSDPYLTETELNAMLFTSDSASICRMEELLKGKKGEDTADYLFAYSSTPGYVSWRNEQRGSWFIQVLCGVFVKNAETDHIVDLLIKVNGKTADAFDHHESKEFSMQDSLTKHFYFHLTPNTKK